MKRQLRRLVCTFQPADLETGSGLFISAVIDLDYEHVYRAANDLQVLKNTCKQVEEVAILSLPYPSRCRAHGHTNDGPCRGAGLLEYLLVG